MARQSNVSSPIPASVEWPRLLKPPRNFSAAGWAFPLLSHLAGVTARKRWIWTRTCAFSLSRDEIVPIDNEASYLLKKIPVVTEEFASGTPQMANKVAEALNNYKIIMLRGHGSFATGQTLDEAFFWSSTLEEACQIALFSKQINEPFIEYRGMSSSYGKF
jgi:hypothetical protein